MPRLSAGNTAGLPSLLRGGADTGKNWLYTGVRFFPEKFRNESKNRDFRFVSGKLGLPLSVRKFRFVNLTERRKKNE